MKLADGTHRTETPGPHPRTSMQVALSAALWTMPDKRFVHEPATLPANVLDMVSRTR